MCAKDDETYSYTRTSDVTRILRNMEVARQMEVVSSNKRQKPEPFYFCEIFLMTE